MKEKNSARQFTNIIITMKNKFTKDQLENIYLYLQIVSLFHRNGAEIEGLYRVNKEFRKLSIEVIKILSKLTTEEFAKMLEKFNVKTEAVK